MAATLPELPQHAYLIVADAPSGAAAETGWSLLSDAYMLAWNAPTPRSPTSTAPPPTRFELTDGTTAVGRAGQVQTPERDEPQRAGRHWIDVARAWTLHGDRTQALDSLNRARRIAPQLTRYHPQVHETVHLLAETDQRATDSLAGFARWAGITL